jgi:hypothetical protein
MYYFETLQIILVNRRIVPVATVFIQPPLQKSVSVGPNRKMLLHEFPFYSSLLTATWLHSHDLHFFAALMFQLHCAHTGQLKSLRFIAIGANMKVFVCSGGPSGPGSISGALHEVQQPV